MSEPRRWVIHLYPNQLSMRYLVQAEMATTTILIVESLNRQRMHPFHKKKLIYEISVSRHFARELQRQGWQVDYVIGEETECEVMQKKATEYHPASITVFRPNDWHLQQDLARWSASTDGNVQIIEDPHHIADAKTYASRVRNGGFRMEFFYREMRRKTGILMEDGKPVGGDWNFDKENRKPLPKGLQLPHVPVFEPDELTQEVISYVDTQFPNHFGSSAGFNMAVTASDSQNLADDFFENRLAEFGPYEDAMKFGEHILFHSGLSPYINLGLLDPIELCRRAEQEYSLGRASLPSVEGFIRQIIGWREFVRVYYDAMMPDVVHANMLGYTHPLPDMYWSGHTQGMRCMEGCLKPVIDDAYIHHIPRLMVLSNFANLTQTDPFALYEWFWYAFVDAHDWVVLPNVLGMSTYADGGVLASKPYIAGGNYINKMSDFCKGCQYDPGKRTGEDACPFTYLYWNFVDRNRILLSQNARLSFPVIAFDKMPEGEKEQIRTQSLQFIRNLMRYC